LEEAAESGKKGDSSGVTVNSEEAKKQVIENKKEKP
jgi:hypothetical protein